MRKFNKFFSVWISMVVVLVMPFMQIKALSLHEMTTWVSGNCSDCQWCFKCYGEGGFVQYMLFPSSPTGYESLGYVKCSSCSGVKIKRCSGCRANNLTWCPSKDKPKFHGCLICRGGKILQCGGCQKTGWISINGMRMICPACNGRGFGVCPECRGTGKSKW